MRRVAQWVMVVAGTVVGAVVQAADVPSPGAHRDDVLPFEIAGFGGWTVGGQFKLQGGGADDSGTGSRLGLKDHSSFAVAADLRASESSQYELFYSREPTSLRVPGAQTNVAVNYLHIGGTLLLNDETSVKPYIAGGLGVTRLSPGDNGSSDTRFSGSLGLGLRWPVTQHLSLRLEGRGFVTLMKDSTAIFCKSDESGLLCRVRGNGTTFVQGQFLAGVAFAF